MNQLLHVSASPHIKDRVTTSSIMLDVIIALIPATLFGIIQFNLSLWKIIGTLICLSVIIDGIKERSFYSPLFGIAIIFFLFKEDLGFDPKLVQDDDLKKTLSGILSIVDGIGAFRTHASSAHGEGRKMYKLKPRHARLAIHSAHTIALFVLETWDEKRLLKKS